MRLAIHYWKRLGGYLLVKLVEGGRRPADPRIRSDQRFRNLLELLMSCYHIYMKC